MRINQIKLTNEQAALIREQCSYTIIDDIKHYKFSNSLYKETDNHLVFELFTERVFFMVVVDKGNFPPVKKHDTYQEALDEAMRLSKKENKDAYVLQSRVKVEQIPNIIQFKFS
jgi:hypothetical protein